jgi:hypothetical protein
MCYWRARRTLTVIVALLPIACRGEARIELFGDWLASPVDASPPGDPRLDGEPSFGDGPPSQSKLLDGGEAVADGRTAADRKVLGDTKPPLKPDAPLGPPPCGKVTPATGSSTGAVPSTTTACDFQVPDCSGGATHSLYQYYKHPQWTKGVFIAMLAYD